MLRDPFYGVPGLSPESFDAAARELNAAFLEDAWRYPSEERHDLEARLRELFGAAAEIERSGSALRVRAELPPRERLEAMAEELATLDTRVMFVKAGEELELLVFVDNPHGFVPRSRPLCIGRALQGSGDSRAASSASCPCGARHVSFVSRKAYGGQETDDIAVPCLACGRSTLLVLGVAGGCEVHLADELPLRRIRWLPAHDAYGLSRADYPWYQRALASNWLPAVAGVAFGIGLVLLLHGTLLGRGKAPPTSAHPVVALPGQAPLPPLGKAHLVATDAGMRCNQRECVLERLAELRGLAADAGASGFAAGLDGVQRALDAGECERALALSRAIKDPADTSFAATKVGIAHLALDLVLDNHCRFLGAQAPEPADQGGGSGSVGSEPTPD